MVRDLRVIQAHTDSEGMMKILCLFGLALDIPRKVYKMLGNLGFKLYFFRLPYTEKTEEDLIMEMSEDFSSKINNIKSPLYEYLYLFETGPHLIYDNELHKVRWNNSKDDVEAKRCIARLGKLLGQLRCIATTWQTESTQGSDYGYAVSQPEDPRRAITVLLNLARGTCITYWAKLYYIRRCPNSCKNCAIDSTNREGECILSASR